MNPNTYGWYQCDEEDYDSNASPEEQADALAAQKQYAAQLIAGMRAAVATVPSYCERPQTDADDKFVSRRARLAADTEREERELEEKIRQWQAEDEYRAAGSLE